MSPLIAHNPLQLNRTSFTYDQFRRLVTDHGYDVSWAKMTMCPNRMPEHPDHHVVNCELCDNSGYIYFDETQTRMIATSAAPKQQYMPESRYEPGSIYVTSFPEHKLNFWDRIRFTSSQIRFSQVVPTHAASTLQTYQLKYSVISVAYVVTKKGTEIPPSEITVELDGRITFQTKPDSAFFAITYYCHPVFLVIDLMHSIRDARSQMVLPPEDPNDQLMYSTQALAKLDFLVRDESRGTDNV